MGGRRPGIFGNPRARGGFPRASEGFGGGPRRPERLEPERVKAEQETLHKTEGGGGEGRSRADGRSSSQKPQEIPRRLEQGSRTAEVAAAEAAVGGRDQRRRDGGEGTRAEDSSPGSGARAHDGLPPSGGG